MKWKTLLKSFEDSGLLLKGVSETIQNEAKEQGIVKEGHGNKVDF